MATIAEALTIALDLHQTGRFAEAEELYRRILDADADNAQALHLCGLLIAQLGRLEEAAGLLARAALANPLAADPQVNHGKVLRALGRPADALTRFRRAIALSPALVEALEGLGHAERERGDNSGAARGFGRAARSGDTAVLFYHWGVALDSAGRLERAVEPLQEAARRDPLSGATAARLASLLHRLNDADGAANWYQRALALRPDHGDALHNLAVIARSRGEQVQAIRRFGWVAALHPDQPEAQRDLAATLLELGLSHRSGQRLDDAADVLTRAVALAPLDFDAQDALALTLFELGRFDEAHSAYRRVVALDPTALGGHYNGALAAKNLGQIAEAMVGLRIASRISDAPWIHSARLVTALLLPDLTNPMLADEVTAWGDRFGRTIESSPALACPAIHGRPLLVGYVSNYLHPGNRLLDQIAPLLHAHDRSAVVPVIYGDVPFDAPALAEMRSMADGWRDTRGMDDDALADQIRADGIDVLVCLIGHTSGQRMGLFTRRPAPRQVSFHGMTSSGVDAMDLWLTDPVLHPADSTETFKERLIRLPHFFLFKPPGRKFPLMPPPCGWNGVITFGSFNLDAKINHRVVALWSRILHAVPGSRLMLKSRGAGLADPQGRTRMAKAFAQNGVGADQLILLPPAASHEEHLRYHEGVDIALDPFPYGGCLTSFDALSMGVPVVTLAGERFIERMTASLLHSLGRPEWVASNEEEYVLLAKTLAEDHKTLSNIRMGLAEQIATSPLCDAASYARAIEEVFRMD
ncbi:tetratricopeptide repeat protein [Azospirillum cavernae]|uniref:protein O-GlcNAc transferase n=1 Tax=Azospirillum cavernae TaxID=2320860 RepID=A0A418VM95_9PROT|nr:tetratricopeptide repeat protein [Azospirillum cavernae]RJF77288.1 tetratricopeptide repeat protein [Azospirillum cavernae]